MWVTSNIAAGTREQLGRFLTVPKLLNATLQCATDGDWMIQKEGAWVIANIVAVSYQSLRCIY